MSYEIICYIKTIGNTYLKMHILHCILNICNISAVGLQQNFKTEDMKVTYKTVTGCMSKENQTLLVLLDLDLT